MNEVGCDEAGRGCLAGPVFGAAVKLPHDYKNSDLNDSKLLSKIKRDKLRNIIEADAVDFAVGIVDNNVIDQINILQASLQSMRLALEKLTNPFDHIIVDGNRFSVFKNIPHTCIIKGDGKFMSIAAASILAKTYRDEFMEDLHVMFPEYRWNNNKGYPTEHHRQAIIEYGITSFHRKSFTLINSGHQLSLFDAPGKF